MKRDALVPALGWEPMLRPRTRVGHRCRRWLGLHAFLLVCGLSLAVAGAGAANAATFASCISRTGTITHDQYASLNDVTATPSGRVAAIWTSFVLRTSVDFGAIGLVGPHSIRPAASYRLPSPRQFVTEGQIVATPSGDLVSVWIDDAHLYWSRLEAGSLRWRAPAEIHWDGLQYIHPQLVALSDGSVRVFWDGEDIPASRLLTATLRAGGTGWSKPRTLLRSDQIVDYPAAIAADRSGAITVIWGSVGHRYIVRSRPSAGSWSKPQSFVHRSANVSLTVGEDGTLVAAFTEFLGPNTYPASLDGAVGEVAVERPGATSFSPPERLTPTAGRLVASTPQVSIGDDGAATLVVSAQPVEPPPTLSVSSRRSTVALPRTWVFRLPATGRGLRFAPAKTGARPRLAVTSFVRLSDGSALAIGFSKPDSRAGVHLTVARGEPGARHWGPAHEIAPGEYAYPFFSGVATPDGGALLLWKRIALHAGISITRFEGGARCARVGLPAGS